MTPMATQATPPIVTRFYRNLDFALDVIANRQVTFVHVDTLNDPFDPYFVLETDFAENHSELIRYLQESHPGDEIWFNQLMPAENWQDAIDGIRDHMAYVRKTTFVFSASSELEGACPKDSLYMWGHYADGHRGVAFEFDTWALASSLMRHSKNSTGEIANPWVRMEYRPLVPPLRQKFTINF